MKRSTSFLAALLFISLTAAASAQVIVNGGFETGSFFGWVVTDASNFTLVNPTPDPGLAHSGNYYANLGATPGPGSLFQSLSTTPGQTYQLSFWLASDRFNTVDNSFEVKWNGASVLSFTNIPAPGTTNPYMNFTIDNLTAAGAVSTLEFVYVNNDDFFRLDDVALSAVPEMSATSFVALGFVFIGLIYYRRNKVSRASVQK